MADNLTTQTATLATVPGSSAIATHQLGTSNAHVQVMIPGGQATTPIAAGTATDTVVKGAAGVLASVLVIVAGTSGVSIFDNATTHTGTIIGILPPNAPAGAYVFMTPAANGITVQGNASNPAITVVWS